MRFGFLISLALAFIAFSMKATQLDEFEWNFVLPTMFYSSAYGLLCWIFFNFLMYRKGKFGFNADSVVMGLVSVICTGLFLLVYDWIYSKIFPNAMQFQNGEGINRYVQIFIRGLLISSIFYFITRHIFMIKDQQKHQLEIGS